MNVSIFAEYETDLQTLLKSIDDLVDGDATRLRGGAYVHSDFPALFSDSP